MLQINRAEIDFSRSNYSFDVKSETSTEGQENDFSAQYNYQSLIKAQCKVPSSKAKTSLCKNFTQKGYCSYGKKCQFAHGPQQLRVNMEHNRSYKTKTCHAFSKKGFCCYGQRCNFIHEQVNLTPASQRWSMMFSNHRQTINPSEFRQQSRLLALLKQ